MIALGFALTGASPIAVAATGMEPQLRVIRQEAAIRQWPITCVGHAGEEGVIRVGVPAGTPDRAVDGFIDAVKTVASSVGNLGVDPTKQSCDQEPVRVESSDVVRDLIFAEKPDPRLLALAKDCGYSGAYWRQTTTEDVATVGGQIDAKKLPNTLDAGENAGTRYGPMTCFSKMSFSLLQKPAR